MCIATGVAYSQNIVLGYDGTLPRHSPSFATMFLQIRNEPFHRYLLPVVDDHLHWIGFEIKRPLSLFRRSVLRMIINPLLGKFEPVLLRLLGCLEISTRDSFNLGHRAELTGNTEDA
jgi:hypothetical protein